MITEGQSGHQSNNQGNQTKQPGCQSSSRITPLVKNPAQRQSVAKSSTYRQGLSTIYADRNPLLARRYDQQPKLPSTNQPNRNSSVLRNVTNFTRSKTVPSLQHDFGLSQVYPVRENRANKENHLHLGK